MPVRVEGLRQAVKALESVSDAMTGGLKEVMGRIASEAAEVAAAHAPKGRTGRLRASIRGNKAKGKAVVTAGRASVPYAGAINYGWPRHSIRPANFLAAADRVMATRAPQLLQEGLDELIEREGLS